MFIEDASIQIQTDLSALPAEFALTGFIDVEKTITITCDSTKTPVINTDQVKFSDGTGNAEEATLTLN